MVQYSFPIISSCFCIDKELYDWLNQLGMAKYYKQFLHEDLYKDLIPYLEKTDLVDSAREVLDKMGINNDDKDTLMKASKSLNLHPDEFIHYPIRIVFLIRLS